MWKWIKKLFKKKDRRMVDTFYSKELIDAMMDKSLFQKFGEEKELPTTKQKIKIRKYEPLIKEI